MKFLSALLATFTRRRLGQSHLRVLAKYSAALLSMIALYAAAFRLLMEWEGREFSWISSVYWTLTVMSTLGFGDITFHTDLGRAFSILVLVSGTLFLLVLFPFLFVQFFWGPWMEAQSAARAPRELPEQTQGHVILTNHDEVTSALIERLTHHGHPYVLLVPELAEAMRLHDEGLRVVVGQLDDPDTYRRVGAERAGLIATTCSDFTNSNVAFTVRGVAPAVPIVASANDPASVDILELAGCDHVLQLPELLGNSLARRMISGDAMTHVIGRLGPLLIAEATAARTPLMGKTLRGAELRNLTGLSVVGIWERGTFVPPLPDTPITQNTVLVLAGTREQLDRYDELFVIYNVSSAPVVILGGGRVAQATARALDAREIDYRIVERNPGVVQDSPKCVIGSAAELEVLKKAGIMDAPAVIITTNDDDTNVYLTIYCRRLRPDVQIITRATHERNVATLHRAGTDFVMSYASMGANTVLNLLKRSQILMVAEGLDCLKVPVPRSLAGKTIASSSVREQTGLSIVAVVRDDDMQVNPEPATELSADAEIILIGSVEAEDRFMARFAKA